MSYAQQLYEGGDADVFIFYRNPDLEPSLLDDEGRPISFKHKASRRKILEWVYQGSWWVNLDSIEGEAVAMIKTDSSQAERFFGNRLVQGAGAWLPPGSWSRAYAGLDVEAA